jgi:hypothetical protein
MATGNTIGRMVGQSAAKPGPVGGANPSASLPQGLQQAMPMLQQLQGMIQQLAGGGGGGAPARPGERATTTMPGERAATATPEALRARLTALGEQLRAGPADMEGAPRVDQWRTRELTAAIAREALRASGPRGSAVDERALTELEARVAELAGAAPSAAQAAQAVDHGATMAGMRGAGPQVMQALQKSLGLLQQALGAAQQGSHADGAQVKQG